MKHTLSFSEGCGVPAPSYTSPMLVPHTVRVEAGFAATGTTEIGGGNYPSIPTTDWSWE